MNPSALILELAKFVVQMVAHILLSVNLNYNDSASSVTFVLNTKAHANVSIV